MASYQFTAISKFKVHVVLLQLFILRLLIELSDVCFARSSGAIKAITDGSLQVDINQSYGYYESFFHPNDIQEVHATFSNVKGNGMCIPGYTDSEGNEMPWLLGSADKWQNSGNSFIRIY